MKRDDWTEKVKYLLMSATDGDHEFVGFDMYFVLGKSKIAKKPTYINLDLIAMTTYKKTDVLVNRILRNLASAKEIFPYTIIL